MKEKLSNKPYFLILFPFFFVLHGYAEYYQFFQFSELILFLLGITSASLFLWLLFRWLLKSNINGALMSIYIMAFYLLFGALFDFLKAYSPFVFFYRYRTLVSGFLLTGIILFFYFRKRKKPLLKPVLFINVLLLIYLAIDLGTIISKQVFHRKQELVQNPNPGSGLIPDSCSKPDIYLLMFDGYASTYALNELFRYDNSGFDSLLVQRGYHLLPLSRSNYNATQVSMASMLNMDFVHWLDTAKTSTHADYVQAGIQIRDNEVMKFLERNGYQTINFSTFDLYKAPSPVNQRWKTLNANMLSQGTFLARFTEEFHEQLISNATVRKWLPVFAYGDQMDNNEFCIAGTEKELSIQRSKPRFVYTHIVAPHFPYYRDRNGKLRPREKLDNAAWETTPENPYTDYVHYNNGVIIKLLDSIRLKTNDKAVIMLMSDHGFHLATPPHQQHLMFYNQCALYLPGKQYGLYYDSISNVNQFRVLFNSIFSQQYPLMKDSSIMMTH